MKKILLSFSLLTLLFISSNISAQSVSKEKAVAEINQTLNEIRLWDYEGLKLDNAGYFKYNICLNPECNPFVSWDFFINLLKEVEVTKYEEYTVLQFTCEFADCIIPTGYEPGGRYDKKTDLKYFIKDEAKGKDLAQKIKDLIKAGSFK